MFFIVGFAPKKGGERILTGSDKRRYTIFYVGNCLSFFFIPLFTFSKVYYIMVGSRRKEITKEEYMQMDVTGQVMDKFLSMSDTSSDFQQAYEAAYNTSSNEQYANEFCPVCKNKLEGNFAFCPYCGQKQPRK